MRTFIRIAEVWVPSEDEGLLELAGGLFDSAPAFGAITRRMCFGRAEGLPGRAWDDGHPVMLRKLDGSYFRRAAAARAEGLSCAVACPIFLGDVLTCVVVLLCGDAESHVGAVELWHNDPRIGPDLTLADGYFGSTSPALEVLTRDSWLPRGAGAPGLAWQRESAVFIDDVVGSKYFLRGPEAAAAGILRALSIPCSVRGNDVWVLSLLSSATTPIALRTEIWRPDAEGLQLQRAVGRCEINGPLPCGGSQAWPIDALGPIGLAWRSGVAQADSGGAVHAALAADEAQAAGLRSLLALPVVGDGAVCEVVGLYF